MGAVGVLVLPNNSTEAASNPVYVAAWLSLYALTAIGLLRRRMIDRYALVVLAFALYCVASAVWSPQPEGTVINAVMLTANVLFVAFSRSKVSSSAFLKVVFWTVTGLALIGSILAISGADAVMYWDVHQRETLLGTQPIRALFGHKITAGVYATIAAVIALTSFRGTARYVYPILLLLFVLATGSTGALALFAISMALCAVILGSVALRLGSGPIVVIMTTVMVIGAIMLGTVLPLTLDALGRDASLTGRSELWGWAWQVVAERPLTGYGYYGYFGSDIAQQAALEIPRFVYYDVPHFHNSYLQTLVDLGVPGIIFQAFVLLFGLGSHYRRALITGDRIHITYSAVLVLIIAAGMGMHTLFQYNSFLTVFAFRAFARDRSR